MRRLALEVTLVNTEVRETEEEGVRVSSRIAVADVGIGHMAVAVANRPGAGRGLEELDAAAKVDRPHESRGVWRQDAVLVTKEAAISRGKGLELVRGTDVELEAYRAEPATHDAASLTGMLWVELVDDGK